MAAWVGQGEVLMWVWALLQQGVVAQREVAVVVFVQVWVGVWASARRQEWVVRVLWQEAVAWRVQVEVAE